MGCIRFHVLKKRTISLKKSEGKLQLEANPVLSSPITKRTKPSARTKKCLIFGAPLNEAGHLTAIKYASSSKFFKLLDALPHFNEPQSSQLFYQRST
jgi:hypothetical protein